MLAPVGGGRDVRTRGGAEHEGRAWSGFGSGFGSGSGFGFGFGFGFGLGLGGLEHEGGTAEAEAGRDKAERREDVHGRQPVEGARTCK